MLSNYEKGLYDSRPNDHDMVSLGGSFTYRSIKDEKVIEMIKPLMKHFEDPYSHGGFKRYHEISVLLTLKDGREIRYCHLIYNNGQFDLCIPSEDYHTGNAVDRDSIKDENIAKIRYVQTSSVSIDGINIFYQKGDIATSRIYTNLHKTISKRKTVGEFFEEMRESESVRKALENNKGISIWLNNKEVTDMNIVLKGGDKFEIRYKYIYNRD